MAQLSEQTAPEGSAVAPNRRFRYRIRGHRGVLSRISIQSKLILMLVICAVLASAVVGVIAYQTGRNSLRNAAVNRLVEIRESQKRALDTQITDLRNALVTYTHGNMTQAALREFTAGFDQLANAPITPEMSKAIADYYDFFGKQTEKESGTRLDVAALIPTSNAERYLQATYTAKLRTNDLAIAMDDERDGSAWSAANAKFQEFYREIVTRFSFENPQ